MLILNRNVNESVVLDDRITVTLVAVRAGKAKIGFTCDRAIPIHRMEVWEQIRAGRRRRAPVALVPPP
jgi:carbon storage regulator